MTYPPAPLNDGLVQPGRHGTAVWHGQLCKGEAQAWTCVSVYMRVWGGTEISAEFCLTEWID